MMKKRYAISDLTFILRKSQITNHQITMSDTVIKIAYLSKIYRLGEVGTEHSPLEKGGRGIEYQTNYV